MSLDKIRLGECCVSISDGDHLPPPKSEKGIPFITISNINSYNQIDFTNTMFVPEDYYNKLDTKRKAQQGDILYSVVGSFGIPILIKDNTKFVFQRHIAILRPDKNVDSRFLYYKMLSREFYALADVAAIGAAQRTISLSALRNMEITLPDIDTQKRIADILSNYDNLIENNQKQIKLLEEAAQRLYKEWFVDLHFPGYESSTITDGVPEEWKECAIIDLCEKINAGGTPSRRNASYWNDATIKWYKTQELQDCWLIDSSEKINVTGQQKSSAKFFPENTILMAIYASPTLGRLGILDSEATCNQAAICLKADEEKISWQWLYEKLYELRDYYNGIARGAGQQNISGDVVKQTIVLCPPKEIIDRYTNIVSPMFEKRRLLQKQVFQLTEARDRLLPKLMNGEIEV